MLRLSHTGFRETEQQESHDKGWSHCMERLKIVAEGGDPGSDSYVEG